MDNKLYDTLRRKVLMEIDADVRRVAEMRDFVAAFVRHVNNSIGKDWKVCQLGVLGADGVFRAVEPQVEGRSTLPFAIQVTLANGSAGSGLSIAVPFVLDWHDGAFRLVSSRSGDNVDFYSHERSNPDILEQASSMLDAPIEHAVEQFIVGK